MDKYAPKSRITEGELSGSVEVKMEGLTTFESSTNIKFATAGLKGLQPIFENTILPRIAVDDNSTDTESHSRRSSISSSPAHPSPLSSIPNTPQLSHVSLQAGDILIREQSLAGLKDDLYGCDVDDDVANPTGDGDKLLLIDSPREGSDSSVPLNEDFNTKDSSAHEREIATRSQDFRPTISVTTEHDNQEANFQHRLFSILRRIPGHPEREGYFPQHTFTALVDEQIVANELHRCHNGFDPDNNPCSQISGQSFAVKRLKSYDRAQFKWEVDMLMTFSGNSHPHLISLLATYEQFDRFYLVFPWAEADLQGYWEDRNPNPSMDHDTILWVAEKCRGIAQGLSKIHRHQTINLSRLPLEDYERIGKVSEDWVQFPTGQSLLWQLQLFGKHGDIKPQNVLWYRDPYNEADRGILKITDFGLAECKTSARNIYKLANRVTVSAPYRPPERDIEDGSIGQSHDIWALGCLYLELVTWLLGGWDLVQKFQSQRSAKDSTTYHRRVDDGTFFDIKRVDEHGSVVAIVKPAVTKFIEDLHANPACTRYIHMLLDLIQTDMLIIKPSSPQEKGRMGIMEVSRILNDLWQDCSDIEFATKPMSLKVVDQR